MCSTKVCILFFETQIIFVAKGKIFICDTEFALNTYKSLQFYHSKSILQLSHVIIYQIGYWSVNCRTLSFPLKYDLTGFFSSQHISCSSLFIIASVLLNSNSILQDDKIQASVSIYFFITIY